MRSATDLQTLQTVLQMPTCLRCILWTLMLYILICLLYSSSFQMDDRLALDGDDVWLLPEHELQLQSLDALAHNKRYVVAQSMVQQSRFNLGLLILFILSIFVVNAFFIVVILMSKALRSSSKHILILSVAFGDLIQGLLILPLITDLGMKGSTVTECSTFHVGTSFKY